MRAMNRQPEPSGVLFKGAADLRKIAEQVGRRGLAGAVAAGLRALRWRAFYRRHLAADRAFDRAFGVDTVGIAHEADLTIRGARGHFGLGYEGTPVAGFDAMLAHLPRDLSSFTYIDFGAGKGRTLLLAARFGFKRIVGVEFSEELHAIAARNIARFRHPAQRCFDVTAVCRDAAAFAPPDGPLVCYFYYPFEAPVLAEVMANLQAAHAARPRKMYFVFRFDKPDWRRDCAALFATLPFARPMKIRASWPERLALVPYTVAVYESLS